MICGYLLQCDSEITDNHFRSRSENDKYDRVIAPLRAAVYYPIVCSYCAGLFSI